MDYSKFHNIHYYSSISGYYCNDFLSAYEACKYLLLHNTNTLYLENAISNLKFYSAQLKQDPGVNQLLLFFIEYLYDTQKPLSVKKQVWELSKELLKTNYEDDYLVLEKLIESVSQSFNVDKNIRYQSSKKILIYTGWMTHLWNDSHLTEKALGGSERAVAYL